MSERLNEYFVREAAEYLDQLERLLSVPGERPDPEQVVRLSRGVRGSAQMAGAPTVAAVAERLEDAARSVHTENIVWSEEIRRLILQTVGDLQVLLRALNRWGDAEEARVRDALLRWDDHESAELRNLAAVRGDETADRRAPTNVAHERDAGGADDVEARVATVVRPSDEVVPIASLYYDDAGPHVLSGDGGRRETGGESEAVPIGDLLLRGPAAIRAALALRPRLDALVHGGAGAELTAVHDELFDLLTLSLTEPKAG